MWQESFCGFLYFSLSHISETMLKIPNKRFAVLSSQLNSTAWVEIMFSLMHEASIYQLSTQISGNCAQLSLSMPLHQGNHLTFIIPLIACEDHFTWLFRIVSHIMLYCSIRTLGLRVPSLNFRYPQPSGSPLQHGHLGPYDPLAEQPLQVVVNLAWDTPCKTGWPIP